MSNTSNKNNLRMEKMACSMALADAIETLYRRRHGLTPNTES